MAAPGPVCSDAERRFAVWAHDDLRARGHAAWVETHWIRPWRAASVALACLLAAVGGLVALAAPVAGLALAAGGALSLAVEAAGRAGPLRRLLPRRATQVVLVAPEGAGVAVLLAARTDVPRLGLAPRFAGVSGGLWWPAAAALGVATAAGARVAEVDGIALGAAQLVPTVVLLVAATVALDALASKPGDGAAEAAAVDAVLAAHAALARDPAPGIAAGVLLGAPDALRVHLRGERPDALLLARPGPLRTRHHQWRAAAHAAGLPARGGGPRGVPAAEVAPEDAERLVRALAGVLAA